MSAKLLESYHNLVQGRTRILLAWVFVFILAFFSRQYPALPGIALCFAGATIRFWASGYLRKDKRLAVGGPYAHSRNPLYLGTYLMAVGTVWAIGNLPLLAAVTVLFAAIYHFVIRHEERRLRELFGETYAKYCEAVPRFFPRPLPPSRDVLNEINPEPAHHQYSWDLSKKNRAYEAYVSFAGMIGFVALAAYLWQNFGS